MRIAIEARALSSRGGGVRTYVDELVRHVKARDVSGHYTVIVGDKPSRELPDSIATQIVPLHHELLLSRWMNHSVPKALRHLKPQLVHFTKAAVPKRKELPTVVTIYDVIPLLFPEGQTWLRRHYWPKTLRHAAYTSDRILTISQASKRDIARELEVNPEKITVTPLAADLQHFRPLPVPSAAEKPYVLYIGQLEPRKNVETLIRAFMKIKAQIPHDLVIAGKAYWRSPSINDDRIKLLGYVPYDDLPSLYAGADLLAWPSIYEGWALPVMEAMACGTPVLVSNGGALPEVVGDAGEIVPFSVDRVPDRTHDTDFENRLAQSILALVSNKGKLATMRERGLEQVKRFSWEDVASQTIGVYRSLC